MTPAHIPATAVGTRQRLRLVDWHPTLLGPDGAPTHTVTDFTDPAAFLREITARKAQIAYAGHSALQPREPFVLERTITHLVLVPATLGLEGACVPSAFAHGRPLPSPDLASADVARRLYALARDAERLARQAEARVAHDTRLRLHSRELQELARQMRRTAEQVEAPTSEAVATEAEQGSLFPA